ncbi:MAG: hypothetical protein WD356_08195 [Pseudomonadales bacterium]
MAKINRPATSPWVRAGVDATFSKNEVTSERVDMGVLSFLAIVLIDIARGLVNADSVILNFVTKAGDLTWAVS